MEALIKRWPSVRAALLTLVIVHGVLYGIYVPSLDEAALERAYWSPLVERVRGLTDDTDEEARARVARLSVQLASAQATVTRPLAWFYHAVKAGQRWNMFSGAEKMSFQLYIEMRRAGQDGWERLYTVHDPDARFEAERLEYRRIRASYIAFNSGTPGPYHSFCRWVAKRAFYTYPDAEEVRLRMKRLDYRDPEERAAQPERTGWANGVRITRDQFARDMRALHE